MSDTEKVEYLLQAISSFRQDFVSTAYSTMGFLLLVLGWLITSKSARAFLHIHKRLTVLAIAFLFLNLSAYAYLALRIQNNSQSIYDQLKSIPGTSGLYEYHLLSVSGVWIFIGFQACVCILIAGALISVLKNPATGINE